MASGTATVALFDAVEDATRGAYNEDGVDLTLIDWMLSLTPSQRLAVLQDAINFFARFQPDDGDAAR